MMLALLCAGALAQEWTQWRGPARDGVVPPSQVPAAWPKALKSKWKVPAGSGYASPVAMGGAAYVHARNAENETVTRYSLATGAQEWSKSYPAPFAKNSYAKDMSKGPFSTPLLRDGRLFTLGVTAILSAWDLKTGALLWRKDFSPSVDTSKLFTGTSMSPMYEAGSLIVHTGDDRGSVLRAFDAATGRSKWTLNMAAGPGYASPILVDGQIVTMTSQSLIGVDCATGKLNWTYPWKDEWLENAITPVRFENLVIFSGVRRGSVALRLGKQGPETVWTNPEVAFYLSTPVLDGGNLYGLNSRKKGQFVCLDAKTGKTLWATNGREATNAAVVSAGANLVWLTSDGDLIVSKRSAKAFEQVTRYSVSDSPVWTQPVLLGREILIKSDASLSLWSLN
jgi:outer membrane protein assembly factor BamB